MIKIDKFNLTAYFMQYNREYFNDSLPFPQFKIKHSYFTLGYFSCNYDDNSDMYNCVLEISDRYDYTEEQLRNIIIHEMIHYYLAYTKVDLPMKHGDEFKNMANKLNKKYGLNITTTIDITNFKKKPSFSLSYIAASILC